MGQPMYLRTIVSVFYHYKNPTKRIDVVESGHHHHLMEMLLVLSMI
jgi:hypothetical protein